MYLCCAACKGGKGLGEWEQCGGTQESEAQRFNGWAALDKPYKGACCPAGWQCFRKDHWYWQCRPTDTLDTCSGPRTIPIQGTCGGQNMCSKDGVCGPNCCESGSFCMRQNQFTWQCQSLTAFKASIGPSPAPKTGSSPAPKTG